MTPRILHDAQDIQAAIFDSQTERLIGNIIWARKLNGAELTASEIAEKFIEWSNADISNLTYKEWELHWAMFQEHINHKEE